MFNWIELLNDFKNSRQPVALVTVTACLGSTPCAVGSRMIVSPNGNIYGTIGGGKLEFQAIDMAKRCLEENKILNHHFTLGPEFEQCCGGKVEILVEPMNKSPELFLFGAGHIGLEICKLLQGTPFRVHLIDSRKNWMKDMDLGKQVEKHEVNIEDFKTFRDTVYWGEQCYVLVLTHDHTIDFDIIAMALKEETRFLGLIGSKTKRVRFHNMLVKELSISEGMDNVVCPIGLEIGGDSPKEIAISVVAQLLQIHYK